VQYGNLPPGCPFRSGRTHHSFWGAKLGIDEISLLVTMASVLSASRTNTFGVVFHGWSVAAIHSQLKLAPASPMVEGNVNFSTDGHVPTAETTGQRPVVLAEWSLRCGRVHRC